MPLDNGENTAPSYVAGRVGTEARGAGVVKSERILMHRIESPFFTGPLRSPERLQNTFAHECFMDEIAARAKADPIAFRLKHLSEERISAALREVAKAANWQARPSPRPNRPSNGVASGRGVACVAYEGDNSYLAMVAEVDVVVATGEVRVKRIVTAQDSGPISNPDGIRNQIEGGALHGMSRALLEEVTWDAQKVTSVDWRTYRTFPSGPRAGPRDRAHQQRRQRRVWCRRGVDHRGHGRDRQRDFRRHGGPRPPGAVHAGTRQGGACGANMRNP